MNSTQHHNVRSATLVIMLALFITVAATITSAYIAEGAQLPCAGFITVNHHQQPRCINGWPYNGVAPVSRLTSSNGDISTRGGTVAPYTSGWFMCAPNEHRVGFDVVAINPFALTEETTAGHVYVFRTANDPYSRDSTNNLATVVITTQTDYKPAVLAANISTRTVEVEVICKHN